jgi:hypothetical protein
LSVHLPHRPGQQGGCLEFSQVLEHHGGGKQLGGGIGQTAPGDIRGGTMGLKHLQGGLHDLGSDAIPRQD